MDLKENPFLKGVGSASVREPWNFILFGATGDLAARKILPALYGLFHFGRISSNFTLTGFASPNLTQTDFKTRVANAVHQHSSMPVDESHLQRMLYKVHYIMRDKEESQSYRQLTQSLNNNQSKNLFYMAVPAEAAVAHARSLAKTDILKRSDSKIVVEKPFGHNRVSSDELNSQLLRIFAEESIYRIDHYLGKETVQNILVIRFANQFLEPLLDYSHVAHIQVTIAETVGVERRGAFYDATGALNDMIQSHALQMLALLTMEPPTSLKSEDVRKAKLELLKSIRIPSIEEALLDSAIGQYAGKTPFTEEPGVSKNSKTETYAAIKLNIENERWQGVPFFIQTGKKLAKRATAITVAFKESSPVVFGELADCHKKPNYLTIRVQPDEGASLTVQTKLPGEGFRTRPVTMDFLYNESVATRVPEAYERLILDALTGDRTNFAGVEEIDLMWRICEPFTQAWKAEDITPEKYLPGTWGPICANKLTEREEARWKRL